MKHIYIFIAVYLAASFGFGRDYYVSPTGLNRRTLSSTIMSQCPTCYAGDINYPFLTIQYAIDRVGVTGTGTGGSPALQAGDVVYIRHGTYRATSIHDPVLRYTGIGGSENMPITFRNYPGENPQLLPYQGDGTPEASGSWSLIKVHTDFEKRQVPKYLVFEGLTLQGNAASINPANEPINGQPGRYCPDQNNNSINDDVCAWNCADTDNDRVPDGCEWPRYNGQGLLVTGPFAWDPEIKDLIPRYGKPSAYPNSEYAIPHHITVRNCTFKEFPGAGLSFQRADYITVENCIVANNCWYTIFGSSGINLYQMVPYEPGAGLQTEYKSDEYRIKIINNICYGNTLKVVNQNLPVRYDGNGIIVDDFIHAQDYTLDRPFNNPNRGTFYYGLYGGRTLVANNIIFGNGGSGIKVYSSQNTDLINNTLYNNGIGDYSEDRLTKPYKPVQYSIFVQKIINEQTTTFALAGKNRVYNNTTYNTIGYTDVGKTAQQLAYSVASDPEDENIAEKNYIGDPSFMSLPSTVLALGLPNKVEYTGANFRLTGTSPAINYGIYQSASPNDRENYSRDALPDAGAYEVSTNCRPYISVGSNYPVVPADFNSSVSATDRKVYRSQKAVTLKDVYSIPYGAVFTTEVTSCNMTPNPVAAGRMISEDFEAPPQENTEVTETLKTAYPNPISEGSLQFSTRIAQYKLFNAAGREVFSGNDADEMSIEGLTKGLYLINLDGQTQKIVIE